MKCRPVLLATLLLAGCSHWARNVTSVAPTAPIRPTEGMWLPNAPPLARLQALGFTPTQAWLDHLRLASVDVGASGAFVSRDGLILTNHHVALHGLHDVSTADHDYVTGGFLATSRADEIKLPGREAKVLVSIQDVTARVNAAVAPALPADAAAKARHAVFAEIERESLAATGFRSNVVTLYGGALYHLYRFKTYTDVRLVFAPEFQAAFFGGDPDNFEYPRYCLDVAILRAYENDRPARVEHYLQLSPAGVSDGDLVLVSGHPHHTDRLLPVSALAVLRDRTLPLRLKRLALAEQALLDYSATSDEHRRQARQDLFGVQNYRKVSAPQLAALRAGLFDEKVRRENEFRALLRSRPNLRPFDAAFDRIAAAERVRAALETRHELLEGARAFNSDLFDKARAIVRAAAEEPKPDADRLPEFTASKREALEHSLFADRPTYPELEIVKLAASLRLLADEFGAGDPDVTRILNGLDPAARAAQLIHGTKLADPAERKRLYQGGPAAVAASDDAMIQLARDIDPAARALRREFESTVTEPETTALAEINRARFAVAGDADYPDATGTLRLAFGLVEGYEQDGTHLPPFTTFAGAFAHEKAHHASDPYTLPASWKAATTLSPATPLDFVSTADITGGNSGSPVVDRAGHQVGIIFDSNRQGIPNTLAYADTQARSISVDSRAILEALRTIYHADALLEELTEK